MTKVFSGVLIWLAFLFAAVSVQAESLPKIVVGSVPGLSAAATYLAADDGYFRKAGLDVEIEDLVGTADGMAMLASNRVQVIEGAYAASYWNALAQGLPIVMALERGSSPLYHKVVIPPDMAGQIKAIADLKGRNVAVNAPNSTGIFELSQVLQSAGLAINDVNLKYIPFPQMAVALTNHAVDAAQIMAPFSTVAVEQRLAVELVDDDTIIKPDPFIIGVYLINTDWAARNQDLARKFFVAIGYGTREYCQAYHHGPNREQVVDVMMNHKVMADRALLERMPWSGRDPDGHLNPATALAIQDWYFDGGLIAKKFPVERLVDASYADYVAKQLGPFELINKDSKLAGCR